MGLLAVTQMLRDLRKVLFNLSAPQFPIYKTETIIVVTQRVVRRIKCIDICKVLRTVYSGHLV